MRSLFVVAIAAALTGCASTTPEMCKDMPVFCDAKGELVKPAPKQDAKPEPKKGKAKKAAAEPAPELPADKADDKPPVPLNK